MHIVSSCKVYMYTGVGRSVPTKANTKLTPLGQSDDAENRALMVCLFYRTLLLLTPGVCWCRCRALMMMLKVSSPNGEHSRERKQVHTSDTLT